MKATKGEAGYIQARKKQLILKAVLEFGIVIALLILGIWQTHTRLNLLTVVAVLGCLPGGKSAGGGNHNLSVSLDCRGTSERDSETYRGFDGCI